MSARQNRLLEILAAAKLVDADLERARMKGAAEAETARAWSGAASNALTGLTHLGVDVGNKMQADAEKEALAAAENVVARHGSATSGAASDLVAVDAELAGPKKSGNVLLDFADDPFGLKAKAIAKAKAKAAGALTTKIESNAKTAEATRLEREAKAAREAREIAAEGREASEAARKATDAERARAREVLREAVAAGITNAKDPDTISTELQNRGDVNVFAPGMFSLTDVDAEFDAQKRARFAADEKASLDEELKRSQIDENKADALKKSRVPSAKTPDPSKVEAGKNKGADGLRKELNMRPEVKAFREVGIAKQKLETAMQDPSPAGDLSIVYAFAKLQDPGSVVKESEFAAAARAGDFGDQVSDAVTRIVTGERLTPAQRADFVKAAKGFYAAHKSAHDAAVNEYADIARRRGLRVEDVIGGGAAPGAASAPPAEDPFADVR